MPDSFQPDRETLARAAETVLDALVAHVPGQQAAAEQILVAYLAGGHTLLEGAPGIGKTLLARTLAATLGLPFNRIQFTPDLMPGDVVGTNVFDAKAGTFRLVAGPVFTEILMADEINRTPPKTQAALLEAMQERQTTIDGTTHPLAEGFFVVATQNPVEFEGTYPLPEAQLDRFLLRVEMGLPDQAAEIDIYRRAVAGTLTGWGGSPLPSASVGPEIARAMRRASSSIHVAPEMLEYLRQLATSVRQSPHVELGVSPRGALCLLEAARAAALVAKRDFVLPDDMKRLIAAAWGHRILLTAEAEIEGQTTGAVLAEVGRTVEVPRT